MTVVFDIGAFAAWCAARAVQCVPVADPPYAVMMLKPVGAGACWQPMMLSQIPTGFELVTQAGELLARASDLPQMLDALEGGVAEPPRQPPLSVPPDRGATRCVM